MTIKSRLFQINPQKVLASIGLSAGLLMFATVADAAEKITIRYSPIEQAIDVKELRTFADTGEQSTTIRTVLEQTKLEPENVRKLLGKTFDLKQYDLNVVLVEKVLNSFVVEIFLQELVQGIRPLRTEAGSLQAMRSAIVASVADDSKISAIEFLEKYPTELLIDGNQLNQIAGRVLKDMKELQAPLERVFKKFQNR